MSEASVSLSSYRYSTSSQARLEEPDEHIRSSRPASQSYGIRSPVSLGERHESPQKKRDHLNYSLDPPMLSWRLDPDESLSDWTLTVLSNSDLDQQEARESSDECRSASPDKIHDTTSLDPCIPHYTKSTHPCKKYFVHRTQLAVGPRRSEYFSKLFKTKRYSSPESKDLSDSAKHRGTKIELRPSAAAAFPILLDFVYSPTGTPVEATTESAVALRHLATCFGIRELFDSVTLFIKKDLSIQTAPAYLVEADTYKHSKLVDISTKMCSEHFESIKFGLLVTLSPLLFEAVVLSSFLKCSSEVLSTRVASYCRCRPGSVDIAMLKSVTNVQIMPRIAPEESLFYLRILMELDADKRQDDDARSEFYERCIKASREVVKVALTSMATMRNAQPTRQIRNAVKEYHSLPAHIKVDLLEAAVAVSDEGLAKDEDMLLAKSQSMKRNEVDITQEIEEARSEMEQLRELYESKLRSYEATMVLQTNDLRAYESELKRFVRMPNDKVLPTVVSEYTYKEDPMYDPLGDCIFGEDPPTTVPLVGQQPMDGWIVKEGRTKKDGRKGKTRRWPMYYYKGDTSNTSK